MVNRSTYYNFFNHTPSARDKDNAYIRSCILALHSKYKKRLGNDSRLALDTLAMAVKNRNINPKGIIFHSDRGAQFTSKVFCDYLDSLDMIQSFSAKGHPYDNAVMESFFKYLKKEETDRHSFASFNELNLSLFEYIHGFYNSVRPHSHNNGLSPNQAEFVFS